MPSITFEAVKMSRENKARLVKEVTRIASKTTGLPESSFYVFIKENEPDNVGVGGILFSELKKK